MEGITRPYRRTTRPFMNAGYPWGRQSYICHPRFAQEPEMYVREFRLLQKDLDRLFEYIEPSDDNVQCYSFRVYELLLRACVEVIPDLRHAGPSAIACAIRATSIALKQRA